MLRVAARHSFSLVSSVFRFLSFATRVWAQEVGPKKAERETFISVIVLTLVKQPRGDIISVHVRREILGHRLEGKHNFQFEFDAWER